MTKRMTQDDFVRKVFDLVGREYLFLENYINANTPILVKHNKTGCLHEYKVRPSHFIQRGHRCPLCFGNPKKSHEHFIQEVHDLVGNEYTVLGEYVNSKTKILLKHNVCNHQYEVAPAKFLIGRRCPYCSKNFPLTNETFKSRVFDLVGDEYIVLEDYNNYLTKVKLRHTVCNHEYDVTPSGFLNGTRCPKCKGGIKKTHEQFIREVYDISNEEYIVLGDYVNSQTKIKFKHMKCENEFNMSPSSFLSGHRCMKCPDRHSNEKSNTTEYKEKVFALVGNEYVVVGEYINAKTHIDMKHSLCGNSYPVKPNNFLYGYRCPFCSSSRGEKIINEYLNKYGIKTIRQYSFPDCKFINVLSFDFAIFYKNEKIICIIEYDGQQHFRPVDFANKGEEWANELFELNQKRDKIKNDYCRDNNIPILRIPYWEFDNIEEILNDFLFKLNK